MDQLIAALPLILAAVVPPLVAAVRGFLGEKIPAKWIPVILPIGGGIVAGVASMLGVDASALQTTSATPDTWSTVIQGILVGSAAVGVHQIKRQASKPPGS